MIIKENEANNTPLDYEKYLIMKSNFYFLKSNPLNIVESKINELIKRKSLSIKRESAFQTTIHKRKSLLSCKELEYIYDHIWELGYHFLEGYADRTNVLGFLQSYEPLLCGGYSDILLVMKYFPQFSPFEYIMVNTFDLKDGNEKQKALRKKMLIMRNNIIIRLLLEAEKIKMQIQRKILSPNSSGLTDLEEEFQSLEFLQPHVEMFKNLIVNQQENIFDIEYEVELFFLSILGHKEKSRIIKQKLNDYFKSILKDLGIQITFDFIISVTVEKSKFSDYTIEEIIILRKILNSIIQRQMDFGIDFLISDMKYVTLLSEGRIWNSITKYFKCEQIQNIWEKYFKVIININDNDLRETIEIEHSKKLFGITLELETKTQHAEDIPIENDQMKEEISKLKFKKTEIEKEIKLGFVKNFRDLLIIMFKNDKKELVSFMLEKALGNENEQTYADLFELCLEYDEEISMYITTY